MWAGVGHGVESGVGPGEVGADVVTVELVGLQGKWRKFHAAWMKMDENGDFNQGKC